MRDSADGFVIEVAARCDLGYPHLFGYPADLSADDDGRGVARHREPGAAQFGEQGIDSVFNPASSCHLVPLFCAMWWRQRGEHHVAAGPFSGARDAPYGFWSLAERLLDVCGEQVEVEARVFVDRFEAQSEPPLLGLLV